MLLAEDLAAMDACLAKITPGKWTTDGKGIYALSDDGVWKTTVTLNIYNYWDARFVANSKAYIENLLAEVRRLQALEALLPQPSPCSKIPRQHYVSEL